MMRHLAVLWVLTLWAACCPTNGRAEQVVLGLSREEISITTSFDGSEILIYGAVKRDTPISPDAPLEVIITVAGPSGPATVWRKERRAGIWVNTEAVEIDRAPSFYAVTTTAPLADILSETDDLRHKISIPRAIRSVGAPDTISDAQTFTDALIRIRENAGSYQLNQGAATLHESTLFDATVDLPANLTEGTYTTRIFLTRDRSVISHYEAPIVVRKVGLERWLFTLSREHALIYGLLSLAIAIAAGWGASAVFRVIRN